MHQYSESLNKINSESRIYMYSDMLCNEIMKTIEEIRRDNLLIAIEIAGSAVKLSEVAGVSSAYISQIKSRAPESKTGKPKGMGDSVARKIESGIGKPHGWMDSEINNHVANLKQVLIADPENPDLISIRKVKLRLSAGISGFAIDQDFDDGDPIFFRKSWFEKKGFAPEKLIAVKVKGESMEPSLYDGDTVVINTADIRPQDGEVYAVNYEGEAVVKRMVRDIGQWWLSSDNPDQRKYHRKVCQGDACIIIGKVIHKQSERI